MQAESEKRSQNQEEKDEKLKPPNEKEITPIIENRRSKKSKKKNSSGQKSAMLIKKELAAKAVKLKEEESFVIDVAQETRRYKQSNKFPSKVLREATVMQYLVDSRVDTTIEQMYQQLLFLIFRQH